MAYHVDDIRAIQADALRHATELARKHKGSAAKQRKQRGFKLSSMSDEAAYATQVEERGEDIAAEMIAKVLETEATKLMLTKSK